MNSVRSTPRIADECVFPHVELGAGPAIEVGTEIVRVLYAAVRIHYEQRQLVVDDGIAVDALAKHSLDNLEK
jgi:hypothetical protein